MGRRPARSMLTGALVVGAVVTMLPRARAGARVHRLARGLGELEPAERMRVASELAAADLGASAGDLLLLARTDHEPAVLDALTRAVLDAPPVARPSANARELLQWATARADA